MLTRLLRALRCHPWMSLGAALIAGIAVTWALRWNALQRVDQRSEAHQQAAVESAFATVEAQFNRLRDRTRGRAEQLATDSVIVQGLSDGSAPDGRPSSLVRRVLDVPLGPHTAVEVYTPAPRILAWKGPRMPLGTAPNEEAFLQRPQTAIVSDGDVRQGLVVWWPVRSGGEVLGAVRVIRTLRYDPPVKNRYIQGFRLQDEWGQDVDEPIRVTWAPPPSDLPSPHRRLHAADDGVLGYVTTTPPSRDRLRAQAAAPYEDVLAGWAVLLVGWILALSGAWYLQLARRAGVSRLPRARRSAAGRFACVAGLWIGARYLLLALDVPSRWLDAFAVFEPLFDPRYFASPLGGGLLRSIGDLFLTGGWAIILALGLLHLALHYRLQVDSGGALLRRLRTSSPQRPSSARFLLTLLVLLGAGLGSLLALAYVVRRAVLDSTLDFFSRTGLLPDPLVFVVLCALFLLVAAVVVAGIAGVWIGLRLALRYRPRWPRGLVPFSAFVLFVVGIAVASVWAAGQDLIPLPYAPIAMGGMGAAAAYGLVARNGGAGIVTVRGLLLAVFAVTLLLYPLLYTGMDAQRRDRMVEAARSFDEGYDPRALYSIQQVLRGVDEELAPLLRDGPAAAAADSLAPRLVRRSLLASLTTYELSLTLFDADGTVRRRYTAAGRQPVRSRASRSDRSVFESMRPRYAQPSSSTPLIDRLATAPGADSQVQYAGLYRLPGTSPDAAAGWVLLRAEPRSLLPGAGSGVPRVLLPDGSFSDLYGELSLAEFQDGTLARRFGQSFRRTRLPAGPQSMLAQQAAVWRSESVRGRPHLTYYARSSTNPDRAVVAVRIPSILAFDHLYYLLRLTVAGVGVGLLVYLLGLYGRYRRGLLPARRLRFRNKVLNAFLVVGIVSMIAVGVVGVQVVTGENDRIVERRLHDHLARVEETLALEAQSGEPLWRVAERMGADSLAARVGLDLRVYDDGHLLDTSRPRLVRDGLVDTRLPGSVYHDLYDNTYRFTTAPAAIGSFPYVVGYQALVDDAGRPQLVVAVPTLAQQEQVAEEQARTLAYLFGALLVLVVVVMLTAVVLANALAQPIARLRKGLEAVGKGQFAEALSVDTRDEIGDLVRTFNEMRAQLAESRRKLAQKERETAWREMARQVAHEIKNPLTPMKLSIQHLRRAFRREHPDADDTEAQFPALFDRITTTLIEQIESLVRIANDFSTFARLPTRVLETLDLNEVIREARRLMDGDPGTSTIELDLHPDPLPVEADREELRRIYINLLKNALQALPDDREGRVRITTTPVDLDDAPAVLSEVIDNGEGIPPDARDKIFEPNFSTKTSGTGLGLAIVKKGIDELGGEIGYETAVGAGTTFWVRLPLAEPDAPVD